MADKLPPKGPNEVLDYLIDASGILSETETLAGSTTVTVSGATLDSSSIDENSVTVWLSGGTAGVPIYLTATLRTTSNRTYVRRYVIPYGEPVSLELARAQCSIDESDTTFDILLATYISAARQWVERYTSKLLVQRTVTDEHRGFCSYIDLRWGPVAAGDVTVAYVDGDGEDQLVTDAVRNGSRLYPSSTWPSTLTNTGVSVTYTAGYGEGEVPEALVQAMLLLIGAWFQNREAAGEKALSEAPFAVTALADQYRDARL